MNKKTLLILSLFTLNPLCAFQVMASTEHGLEPPVAAAKAPLRNDKRCDRDGLPIASSLPEDREACSPVVYRDAHCTVAPVARLRHSPRFDTSPCNPWTGLSPAESAPLIARCPGQDAGALPFASVQRVSHYPPLSHLVPGGGTAQSVVWLPERGYTGLFAPTLIKSPRSLMLGSARSGACCSWGYPDLRVSLHAPLPGGAPLQREFLSAPAVGYAWDHPYPGALRYVWGVGYFRDPTAALVPFHARATAPTEDPV